MVVPVCRSSGNAFVSESGGLRFKLWPVKSETVLSTVRHRCNISSKEAVLPGRNDAEIGPANLLHASEYYSEYNERFKFGIKKHPAKLERLCATSKLYFKSLKFHAYYFALNETI